MCRVLCGRRSFTLHALSSQSIVDRGSLQLQLDIERQPLLFEMVPAALINEVAALFNSQPHIDLVETGLTPNDSYSSDKFTFMLKHKHFDICPGEVLFVEKVEKGYDVRVRQFDMLERSSKPCMWLFANGWKAFGYTRAEFGSNEEPNIPEGNYNLGVRWLNNGGIEHTDELQKIQKVRPESTNTSTIVTFVNWEGAQVARKSVCVVVKCIRDERLGIHLKPHTRSPTEEAEDLLRERRNTSTPLVL